MRGGDGNDTIYGDFQLTNGSFSEAREGDDILEGGAGIDNLIGGGGDDRLIGGADNDTIRGDFGVDTAVFTGNLADYTFNQNNNNLQVVDGTANRDAVDNVELRSVEFLEFADGTIPIADVLTIKVDVGDTNDSPVFRINEDAVANDSAGFATLGAPIGGTLAWTLTSDSAGRFAIDSGTGELTYTGIGNIDADSTTITNAISGAPNLFVDVRVTNGTDTCLLYTSPSPRD